MYYLHASTLWHVDSLTEPPQCAIYNRTINEYFTSRAGVYRLCSCFRTGEASGSSVWSVILVNIKRILTSVSSTLGFNTIKCTMKSFVFFISLPFFGLYVDAFEFTNHIDNNPLGNLLNLRNHEEFTLPSEDDLDVGLPTVSHLVKYILLDKLRWKCIEYLLRTHECPPECI